MRTQYLDDLHKKEVKEINEIKKKIKILTNELEYTENNRVINTKTLLKYLVYCKYTTERLFTCVSDEENTVISQELVKEYLPEDAHIYTHHFTEGRRGESKSVWFSRGWDVVIRYDESITERPNVITPLFVSGKFVLINCRDFSILGDSIDGEIVEIVEETEAYFKVRLERRIVSNVTYMPFQGFITYLILDKKDLYEFIDRRENVSLIKNEAPKNPNHSLNMIIASDIEEDENLLDMQTHKIGH